MAMGKRVAALPSKPDWVSFNGGADAGADLAPAGGRKTAVAVPAPAIIRFDEVSGEELNEHVSFEGVQHAEK